MGLPAENKPFPPTEWAPAFAQYGVNDAWYTGDVDALLRIYNQGSGSGSSRGDSDAAHFNTGNGSVASGIRRIVDNVRDWFSGSSPREGQRRARMHSPLAGNLATLSADVLVSEPPTVRLITKGESVEGEAQERLDLIANSPDMRENLILAAEYAAGLSGVVLTANWDIAEDHPYLGVIACDGAIPEWQGRRQTAVTMWTQYPLTDAAGVSRAIMTHVERHEPGRIIHALYKSVTTSGTGKGIGVMVPLGDLDATAHIAMVPGATAYDEAPLAIVLPTGIDRITAQYWRNLPTRQFRRSGNLSRIGRSDFEGVEHFLDQVDMVWSSWMRDIKIARGRLIVPDQYLDDDFQSGPSFDDDAEVIKALNFADTDGANSISATQFAIRADEHARTILELTKEVLQHAGYSLSSYGEYGGEGKTATEVVDRSTATERTRDKKALYMVRAFVPILEALLDLDRVHFAGVGIPVDSVVDVQFTELSQVDPEKEARVFQFLRSAMVASTETMVRERNPDWDDKRVQLEVEAIVRENNLLPDLDPGTFGRSEPPADPDDDLDLDADPDDVDPDPAGLEA